MNNKGIILSTYVYMLLIFFLLVLGTLLVVLNNTKILSKKINTKEEFSIVLLGNKEIELIVGDTFTDPGYIAQTIDGEILTATIESNVDMSKAGTYLVTYTVVMNSNKNKKTVTRTVKVVDAVTNFDYTGGLQTFVAPATGRYKLEVWGAQGGYANTTTYNGGYGGYSVGVIYLQKNNVIYVYVGGKGANGTSMSSSAVAGGFNGGGSGFGYTDKYVGGGGGATHIATKAGTLSTLSSSTSSILIVAAGGGGAAYETASAYGRYGYGGGFTGVSATGAGSYVNSTGGTQSAGGSGTYTGAFGRGATCSSNGCGGGGGGYYGGGSGGFYGGGSGGSSYIANSLLLSYSTITKSMYCYSCTTSSTSSTLTYSTTNVAAAATANYAKSDNGYAKITYLGES